ncbi:hypothetical protein [Dorea longicatena]|uniref:hypothetical protein n=1 Tax=Dorea longicatena TaxID=88431 RepID=UPI00156F3710|nr:hypothetical protein [Dorea longicatena]NSD67330.1 hypothetical protein [Dorea longicatena]
MTEKHYSMEFLREVQKWGEAYKKWSKELDAVDTQMEQYILKYLEKEETGVQEMIKEIIVQLPGSSTKRMLIDKVENLEIQERHGFEEGKNSSVPVVKKINTYIKEYHFCYDQRYQVENELRNAVLDYMQEHQLQENLMAYKQIIEYLPASFFRFKMYETYYELEEKRKQQETVSKRPKKKAQKCR